MGLLHSSFSVRHLARELLAPPQPLQVARMTHYNDFAAFAQEDIVRRIDVDFPVRMDQSDNQETVIPTDFDYPDRLSDQRGVGGQGEFLDTQPKLSEVFAQLKAPPSPPRLSSADGRIRLCFDDFGRI